MLSTNTYNPVDDVFLVTREPQVVNAVSGVIGLNGSWTGHRVCADLQQLADKLEEVPDAAVLVDIDPDPEPLLARVDALSQRFWRSRFVVLSGTVSSDLVLHSMQAGARHFMLKTSIAADLGGVLRKLVPDQHRWDARGAAVTLLSAAGGCGATTLTVNLGAELQASSSEPVLLVDMDCAYGSLGPYLGARGEFGLADLLAHAGEIDPQLVSSTAAHYKDMLHVLLSPATLDFRKPLHLQHERLREALVAAKAAYSYVVVDAPRVPLPAAVTLAQESALTLIVFQLSVRDIRIARAMRSSLIAAGVPENHVLAVLNRYHSRHVTVTIDEAKRALGVGSLLCISNDFRSAVRGFDFGQPLVELVPRSNIRRDLRVVVERILEARSRKAELVHS